MQKIYQIQKNLLMKKICQPSYILDTKNYNRQESYLSQKTRTSSIASYKKQISVINPDESADSDDEDSSKNRHTPKAEKELNRLKKDLKKEGAQQANLFNILKYARPEWTLLIIAFIASATQGTVFPAFSLFLTQIFDVRGVEKDEVLDFLWSR